MPITVPNSPTNGAAEPSVARKPRRFSTCLHLARERHVERLVDARLQTDRRARAALERTLPFAHRRREQGAHAGRGPVGQRAVEVFQRLAGPEHVLEPVHAPPHGGVEPPLVPHDRPAEGGRRDEPDHDDLHHERGVHEQVEQRGRHGRFEHGRIDHRGRGRLSEGRGRSQGGEEDEGSAHENLPHRGRSRIGRGAVGRSVGSGLDRPKVARSCRHDHIRRPTGTTTRR